MSWWRRLRRRSQMEEQLEKELQFHLEQHTNDLIKQGCDLEEARRQARLTLGGPEQVKEQVREMWRWNSLETIWQDLHYAARTLRKNPGASERARGYDRPVIKGRWNACEVGRASRSNAERGDDDADLAERYGWINRAPPGEARTLPRSRRPPGTCSVSRSRGWRHRFQRDIVPPLCSCQGRRSKKG
jgi:hypothetical protein